MKRKGKDGFYNRVVKRFFDLVISLLVLVLFSWLFLILAILVRIFLGAPVIFTQERPGLIDPKTGKERIFRLCKFRSMTDERDENGELLPDARRLTRFGRILRATSLDELPEFWNIFRGDMSFVGPRPWLVRYLPYYNEREHSRHLVRPGLTGLAQVSGRNALTWARRFDCDIEYVENVSLGLDLRILFRTVKKVFVREGIEFETTETIQDYFANRD